MSDDRYTRLMGLPAGPRPPRSHVLLGVEPDVNDPEIIEAAVQRRMDQLDQYALSGDRTTREQVQKLMNEVAKARVKLVERAKARAEKAKPVESPKPESMPVLIPVEPDQAPAKPVPVLEPTGSTAEPSPVVVNEQTPALRKPSFQFNFKFKFAMPRLSAEAWSLMGVAWLMSLAVAAVGAYFIASSQTVSEPTPIAGNTPTPTPIERESVVEPETEPDPKDPAVELPPVEPDDATQPTQPSDPPADALLTWEQVEHIQDPDARLQAFIKLRDSKADDLREQAGLIAKALGLFNDSTDVHVGFSTDAAGNRTLDVGALNVHGRNRPTLDITDISPLTGIELYGIRLHQLTNIRDFAPLGTTKIRSLDLTGCTGLTDYAFLNTIKGLESLTLSGTMIDDLNKLGIPTLNQLSIASCKNLTSLDGLEGKTIATLIASQNPQLKNIDALSKTRGLKEVNLSNTGVHRIDPLAAHQLTSLNLGSCYAIASITPLEQIRSLRTLVLPPVGEAILQSDLDQLTGWLPSVAITHFPYRLGEPDTVVHTHIAEHNKLDKIDAPADRHAAFIKLRDQYEPFSEAQIDLVWRELRHVNNARDVAFDMQDDPVGPRVMIGMVDNQIGTLNNAITNLSPLEGIKTHTLSVQYLPNLQDFDFLKTMTVDTLDLTGCRHFEDVSIFKEVKGLSVLKLDKTGVSDLNQLQIDSLKTLSLVGCKGLRDLDGLQGMQLEALSAAGCTSLRDISALAPVRGLKLLNLDQTAIQSALPIAGQKGLKFLSLKGCEKLATVSGLNRLVGLEHLYLHDTPSLDHVDVDRLQKLLRETNVSFKDEDIAYNPDDEPKQVPSKPAPTDQPAPLSFDQIKQIQDKKARQTEYLKLRDSLEPYSREQALLVRDALIAFNDAKNVRIRITTNNKDAFTLVNTEKDKNSLRSPLRAITDLSMLEGLTFEALDLSGLSALNEFSVLSKITVKELSLRYCGALDRFDDLNGIDGLESLDVSNTSISSLDTFDIETLDTLMISGNRQLTSLDGLDGSTIRYLQAEGIGNLSDISALRAVRGLKWLDLSGSNITSTSDLTGQSLTQIDLRDCSNLYALSGLDTMRSLRKLDITATPRLSERYVDYLESSNNNLKVTR